MTTGANNFKPFAVGGSANAITQSAYEALTTLIANGFLDGVADAAKVNKVLRQAAFGSAVLGEIVAANGVDALDDGDLAGFKTKLLDALNAALSITVPDASATVKGKVELATPAETIAGTDSERAVTPEGAKALFDTLTTWPVRQTVLGGPVDSNGLPSFLPSTSASLSLTSQNISAGSAALVVSAANGFASSGALDRVGHSTANLTWSGLAANATNYLYVDVAANGSLTTGSTTLAPVYQQGGTRSATNGQATYNIAEAYMSVGNGSSAVQSYRVFVGEAATGAGSVTSTLAYAYQGAFISPWVSTLPSSGALLVINHNIGSDLVSTDWEVENLTAEFNYTAGMRVKNPSQGSTYWHQSQWRQGRNTTTCRGGSTAFCQVVDATSGVMATPTAASWKYRVFVKRDW